MPSSAPNGHDFSTGRWDGFDDPHSKEYAFYKSTLSVPAVAMVVMTFENQDSDITHNTTLYTNSSTRAKIFVGDFVTGIKTMTYTFDCTNRPRNYFFRCDVHPEQMFETFVVT